MTKKDNKTVAKGDRRIFEVFERAYSILKDNRSKRKLMYKK